MQNVKCKFQNMRIISLTRNPCIRAEGQEIFLYGGEN
jgi:hypothetical protein